MSKREDNRLYTLNTTSHEFLDKRETHVDYSPSILTVIFGILFIFMYFQVVAGIGTGLSFTGLLNVFAQAPSIDISWISRVSTFTLDVPIIGALVNFMSRVISVALYFSVGIAQIVLYLGYFLGFLFGVV